MTIAVCGVSPLPLWKDSAQRDGHLMDYEPKPPFYHGPAALPGHYTGPQLSNLRGLQHVDLTMLQSAPSLPPYSVPASMSMMSPAVHYTSESHWGSEMELGTPTTAGFQNDRLDGYGDLHSAQSYHLQIPKDCTSISPREPRFSPTELPTAPRNANRPSLSRSITAPAAPQRKPGNRKGNCEQGPDTEDEHAPHDEGKEGRGRKRQRIPHTAVERRYRENLNAHLDRLRQTVPALASRPSGNTRAPGELVATPEGVKPSKCEILTGAVEHIAALGGENLALRAENKALRARLDDLERWCNTSLRNGATLGR